MTKQEQMFALVEQWNESTLSKGEFAAASGIAYHTFTKWCRRYKQKIAATPHQAPQFIEITQQAQAQENTQEEPGLMAKIDLELPCGIRIKIY